MGDMEPFAGGGGCHWLGRQNIYIQSNLNNSNLQGKLINVRVIRSWKQKQLKIRQKQCLLSVLTDMLQSGLSCWG